MQKNRLIVLVKNPRIGEVKARLAEAVGRDIACHTYRVLVATLLTRLESLPNVELRVSPDEHAADVKPWLREGWQLRPQGAGELGARLGFAFQENFSTGAERVVVIGSDCPELTVADIEAAWLALDDHDVVIGPVQDGGYGLIGLRAPQPSLFEGISWNTDAVFCQTMERAKAAGLKVHVLRELADVNTEADWKKFLAGKR